jgi:hypothetical protein
MSNKITILNKMKFRLKQKMNKFKIRKTNMIFYNKSKLIKLYLQYYPGNGIVGNQKRN